MSQAEKQTIVLIEPDGSLRRLIALGLQHRGMRVIEAASPDTLPPLSEHELHLLILDIDNTVRSNWNLLEEASAHPSFANLPIVVLTWQSPEAEEPCQQVATATATMTRTKYLAKPFDARVLYTAVEQLLSAQTEQEDSSEALLLASYNTRSSLSLWPIVTAVGLLLAFTGMLLQFSVTIVGLLIVAISLLLWTTTGSSTETRQVLAG